MAYARNCSSSSCSATKPLLLIRVLIIIILCWWMSLNVVQGFGRISTANHCGFGVTRQRISAQEKVCLTSLRATTPSIDPATATPPPPAAAAAATEQPTSCLSSQENNNGSNLVLYLFSLPAYNLLLSTTTTTTTTNSLGALMVRRIWDWKDDVLGDGRDFFVPRPKTLTALNEWLRQGLQVQECVVLSNCARFDIIMVVKDDDDDDDQHTSNTTSSNTPQPSTAKKNMEEMLRQQLATCLVQQLNCYKKSQTKKFPWSFLLEHGDNPKRLLLDSPLHHQDYDDDDKFLEIQALSQSFQQPLQGPEEIARYMCGVATGLQSQSRRPDRPVVFRPFSSRDAHVMLQLKRTADIAASNSNSPRIKALIDTALQSGKAARDPHKVPAIVPLKQYGTGGQNSRYSVGQAPLDLCQAAALQAQELAIEPMVKAYVAKWIALEASDQVQQFRDMVVQRVQEQWDIDLDDTASSPKEVKQIRALMHPYLIKVRQGGGGSATTVVVNDVVDDLLEEIDSIVFRNDDGNQ